MKDWELFWLSCLLAVLLWVVVAVAVMLIQATSWTGVAILGGFAATTFVVYKLMRRFA